MKQASHLCIRTVTSSSSSKSPNQLLHSHIEKLYMSSMSEIAFRKALSGCFPLWVWFRKSLVDPAPWWLCHDSVGSSQQLDQAKQAGGYAYNFLRPRCRFQNMGHAECSGCLLMRVCVFLFFFVETIFCKTVCFYFCRAETSLHCTDWQLNPSCFYSSVLKHRWSITGTECTPTSGPLGFISRLSFNVRALSCALVSPRGGKMKKPPNLTSSISSKR